MILMNKKVNKIIYLVKQLIMSHSRSASRGSVASSLANKPLGFRTIHRNRSSHEVIESSLSPSKDKSPSKDIPTQSRLERLLNLSPTLNQQHYENPLSEGRRSSFQGGSQLLKRSRHSRNNSLNLNKMIEHQKQYKQEAKSPNKELASPRSSISNLSHRSNKSENKIISRLTRETESTDLAAIDEKLNQLINSKLSLVKEHLSSKKKVDKLLFATKATEIDSQLQQLLEKIIKIKTSNEISAKNDEILNKKIAYIETLLAEQMTELELMKKRVHRIETAKGKSFEIQTTPSKQNIIKAFQSFSIIDKEKRQLPAKSETTPIKRPKPCLNPITLNRTSFKEPNPEDYESFRFKHKPIAVNNQPLPRSSYKRDYLKAISEPSQKVVIRDNSEVFPKHYYDLISLYSKEFKKYKPDLINHKQLDAYKDKLKFVNVSYMPKKKCESFMKNKVKQQKKQTFNIKLQSLPSEIKPPPIKSSETESKFSKNMLISEARREFIWGNPMEKSRIKHQQLKEFQYRLKNLYQA